MKYFSLLLLLFCSSAFAQGVFSEKGENLSQHFVNSEALLKNADDDRFDELTRTDGYVINDTRQLGSVFTKRLHRSGKVIFSSEAGDYLNKLKSHLLEDYPKVDELISVYVTDNATLNAFATVNNNIYINIGLLARVENEAQLAFILAHEIMHIVNAHLINQSLSVVEKAEEYGKNDLSIDDDFIMLYKHQLSQEHETEADLDGFTLFLQQDYNIGEARKALSLLEYANDYTIDIPLTSSIIGLSDSILAQWIHEYDHQHLLNKNTKKEDTLRTHPLIHERIESIDELYTEVDSSQYNSTKYIVSEQMFNQINKQAKQQINRIFSEDLDFISLYLYSTARLRTMDDRSNENLNYLGYSIQGLVIDKVKDYDAGEARSTNATDTIFSYFYKKSKDDEFFSWSYSAIKKLSEEFPENVKLQRYKNAITQTIVNKGVDSLQLVFGDEHSSIDMTKITNINGLDIEKLDFYVRPWADLTKKQIKSFNEVQRAADLKPGKVAIINMNNVKIRKDRALSYNYVIDESKMEVLDRRTDNVWLHLEDYYEDQIVSLIPNPIQYSGEDYMLYDKLNQWFNERLYFNNYYYVTIHEDAIKSILNEHDLRYAVSNLNVEIKAFSFKSFIIMYFSPFVMFHYVPQLAANIVNGSTRKYQLSLIYDIETGELAYWNKRTYVDPSTEAQFNGVYQNMLNDFLNR